MARSKYKKRSKEKKRQLAEKALKMVKNNENLADIARKLTIPRSTLQDLLKNDEEFRHYKNLQLKANQLEWSKLAYRSAKQARKKLKSANFKDTVVGGAIAHDKAFPQKEAQVNIGDNRTLNVRFTRWKNAPFGKAQSDDQ